MNDRRRNLMMGEKVWTLLLAGTTVFNTSEGGYVLTAYAWTTSPLSDFVGSSSKYVINFIENYVDPDLPTILSMIMEVSKRDGSMLLAEECELSVTSSPLTPPSIDQKGDTWVRLNAEDVLQSNGITTSSNLTAESSLGWYLNGESMAEVKWVWNYFPSSGGGGSGDSDTCPNGGNHSWAGMEQTGSVTCPYCGELTSCTRYQCRKCGSSKYVFHCGHGE